MTYTIQEAADALKMSYSAVYGYVRALQMGGDGKRRQLSPMDLESIKQEAYMRRRRRSKTYRLEERIESLESKVAELDLVLESHVGNFGGFK